jgi:hypothetical protein
MTMLVQMHRSALLRIISKSSAIAYDAVAVARARWREDGAEEGGRIYDRGRDAVRQDTTKTCNKRTSSRREAAGQRSSVESDRIVGGSGHVAIRWLGGSLERCTVLVQRDRASQSITVRTRVTHLIL